MAWNRDNWKTTVTGILAAAGLVIGPLVPPAKPIIDALSALSLALFGYFSADAK